MKSLFRPFGALTLVAWLMLPGFAQSPAPKRPANGVKGAGAKPAAEPQNTVAPDAFPNVPAALEALRDGLLKSERQQVYKAEGWLALQKEKAVPALAEAVGDEGATIETRIAACRALGRVGPAAAPALFETIKSEKSSGQLKLKAVESLSYVRPSTREIVDGLVGILDDEDARMRQVAVQGLARIGPPAKSSADALLKILNDTAESETMRGEAKRALKEVDLRRGLMGIAPKK